ncbi:MAG: cohesin domain-containing protein [Saprospiraceae bacterium]
MRKTECTNLNYFTDGQLDRRLKSHPFGKGPVRVILASFLMVFMTVWAGDAAAQCTLSCNDDAQVSLPGTADDCEALIVHSMILTNPYQSCPGPKTVTVYDPNGNPVATRLYGPMNNTGSLVDERHIGFKLTVRVRDNTTGNYCWGAITVEDKNGPTITNCVDTVLYCVQNPKPVSRGGVMPDPTFDDCMGTAHLNIAYTDQVTNGICTDTFSQIIDRTWVATDPEGNSSTCTQRLIMRKVSLANYNPTCPANAELECNALNPQSTNPSNTGYPYVTIGGTQYPIIPGGGGVCELVSSYSDETFQLCGGGTKILRTWTVYDWCLPTNPGTNPFTCIQVIKIEDTQDPVVVSCAPPVTVSTNSLGCTANVNLLPANIVDSCSGFDVTVITPVGYIYGNGGYVANVPVGVHTLTYVATDGCGNSTSCTSTLTVRDQVAPVAVCDEFTVVSLSNDGTATVNAATFDDGSTDNCGVDRYEVRRMPDACQSPTTFGPTALFNCCDVGDTVMVTFRVYDASSNYNDCMVEVWVQDKLPPVIDCPPAKTVDCSQQIYDFSVFGSATASDNCDQVTITVDTIDGRDQCGTGYVDRVFTATDRGGRTASCTQRITIDNQDPLTRSDIDFPRDWTTNECGVSTDPDDIPCSPVNYCRPIFNNNTCGLVAVTKEDQLLPIAFPACYKILRKWIVVDWCQYDPNSANPVGYWEWTQVIKVLDNEAPVLDCPTDTVRVDNFSANCDDTQVTIPVATATDCSPDLDFVTKIDYDHDGFFDVTIQGPDASGVYPNGTHLVRTTVEDNCGNYASCDIIVIVTDKKKPTPICLNGVSASLMPDGNGGGMIVLDPIMFNNNSFDNCTPRPDLKYKITPNTFTCDELGLNLVRMSVTDESGNTDFCETFVDIQDNMGVCDTTSNRPFSLAGTLKNAAGQGIQNVKIDLNGNQSVLSSFTTSATGQFSFTNLQAGYDYTLAPRLADNITNGVSTYDLVLISKHVLFVKRLDTPYQIIAADVNNSGDVTTLDLVAARKAVLRVAGSFPNNNSWRFVDKDFVFPNPQNPFASPFPEVINFNDLAGSDLEADFIAIKVGDVNGDATPNLTAGVGNRSFNGTLTFETAEQEFAKGEFVTVPFTSKDFSGIVGYQYTIEFDQNALELTDIETGDLERLTESNFGLAMVNEGVITTSWDNSKTTLTGKTGVLFTLQFRAKEAGTLSNLIKFSSQYTAAEAYAANAENLDFRNVNLDFNGAEETADGFELYQNTPNPFTESTTIGFNLPEADLATLTVYDVAGKVLKVYQGNFEAGYNVFQVNNNELAATGVLYYRLETTGHTATRKMILVK